MTAIKTNNLSKYYGDVKALDNLNLEVPENVVFGFLGPNGAGKTTAVKLLTGFSRPTSGTAEVAGESVIDGTTKLQSKIGLLPDVPAFYEWMTGREFMRFVGETYRMPVTEITKKTDELLDLVDLTKAGGRRVGGYSRGMRQRLGIAQALMNNPRVLFLDEPTSALDPMGRREVLDLIGKLRKNATIFMSTHILTDVERVCDMVGVINKGRLMTVSTVEALREKYARSVFELEFIEDAASFIETVKKVDWLADPSVINDHGTPVLRVRAVDVERARRELPKLIGSSGLTLTRYEMTAPSLEDIFVEMISGEGAA